MSKQKICYYKLHRNDGSPINSDAYPNIATSCIYLYRTINNNLEYYSARRHAWSTSDYICNNGVLQVKRSNNLYGRSATLNGYILKPIPKEELFLIML